MQKKKIIYKYWNTNNKFVKNADSVLKFASDSLEQVLLSGTTEHYESGMTALYN